MRGYRLALVAMAACTIAGPGVAQAAGPVDPASVQAPIKGADPLGDKGRTGPDGWSWAPQVRDQAPGDKGNQTANNGRGDQNSQPGPDTGKPMKPGEDPGTPMATDNRGPGSLDAPKKP